MGAAKSKIPVQPQGQVLKLTGIPEFDKFYSNLEPTIKAIQDQVADLDLRTTDLIQFLGVQPLWEMHPDVEILIRIILTILAVAGKGSIKNVANFIQQPPFIKTIPKTLKREYEQAMTRYEELTKSVNKIWLNIQELKISESSLKESLKIQQDIPHRLIELQYDMKEKIQVLANVNQNTEVIKRLPENYINLLSFAKDFKFKVLKVVQEAQGPPFSDVLLNRSVQSLAGNEKSIRNIVEKFWPVV